MENDLETLATKRVQARTDLVMHCAMYLVTQIGLFAIWRSTGRGYPWFVWPALAWGIGIVAHALALAIGPGSAFSRRARDRELSRLRDAAR